MPDILREQSNHQQCHEMLDAFIQQRDDMGAKLLSALQRYIHYCGNSMQPLSAEDQQEVLQEVSIKLLKRHKQLTGNCNGWLFTIVRNEYIDLLRRQNRQNRLMVPDDSGNLVEVTAASTLPIQHDSQLFDETECLEHVFDHIEKQPTGEMDISIYTQYAMGMTNNEIAEKTGRTQGAIAKRISLLRQRVKQLKAALC